MIKHSQTGQRLLIDKIKRKEICFAGNSKLKIYGTLHCKSGKRMKKENRVFFHSQSEAINLTYRPCGHCMKDEYKRWKCFTGSKKILLPLLRLNPPHCRLYLKWSDLFLTFFIASSTNSGTDLPPDNITK